MESGERAPQALWACLDLAEHYLGAPKSGRGVVALDIAAALIDRATCALEYAPSSRATEALAVAVVQRSAQLVEAYAGHRIGESLRYLESAKRAIDLALSANPRVAARMEACVGVAALNALLTYDVNFDARVRAEGYLVGVGDELLGTARSFLFASRVPRARHARRHLARFEAALDRVDEIWGVTERQIENGYRVLTDSVAGAEQDRCAEVAAELIVGSEQLANGWEIAVAERRPLTVLHGLRVLTNATSTDAAIYAADATVRGIVGAGEEWCAFVECVATRELPATQVLTRSLLEAPNMGNVGSAVVTDRMREALRRQGVGAHPTLDLQTCRR